MWIRDSPYSAPSVARLLLMSESQHEDGLLDRHIAIERHIACLAKADHQLAELGLCVHRSTKLGRVLQEQELPLDQGSGTGRRVTVLLYQELPASLETPNCTCCDDYSWHAGASVSASLPQPRNQLRVSLPVRCWPVC